MYAPIALKQRSDSRWYQYLRLHSEPFKALCEAQERGWNSSAIGSYFDDKKVSNTQHTENNAIESDAGAGTSSSTSHAPSTVFTSTSFDLDQLCTKYREHAEQILPQGNSDLFLLIAAPPSQNSQTMSSQNANNDQKRGRGFNTNVRKPIFIKPAKQLSASRSFSFLDLGAAPGGVSHALHRAQKAHLLSTQQFKRDTDTKATESKTATDIIMSDPPPNSSIGVSVSLSTDMGGIGMSKAMLAECSGEGGNGGGGGQLTTTVPPYYCVLYESVTEVNEVVNKTKEAVLKLVASQSDGDSGFNNKFDLVNGGAVADFGQRNNSTTESNLPLKAGALPPLPPRNPVPWFQLFVPQLLIALQMVKAGGDMMLVFGLSDSCSLLLLCDLLSPLLRAGAKNGVENITIVSSDSKLEEEKLCAASSSNITILPTMHFTKPPIYIYFKGVYPTESAFQSIREQVEVFGDLEELEYTTAISNSNNGGGGNTEELRSKIHALWQKYHSLHEYWAGESDIAFQKSEKIFEEGMKLGGTNVVSIRAQLEKLWSDRAEALTLKLNKIEQMAAKRPR